jgi:cytochrome c oxidase subunit 3
MAGAVKHDYHLVDPSPWPFVGSLGAFVLALGAVIFMAGLST